MDYAMWVEMMGGDSSTQPQPPVSYEAEPVFDSLFPYRRTDHSADKLIRSVEHDSLIREMLGDDAPLQTITPTEKPASTFDKMVEALIDEALEIPGHLQKIRRGSDFRHHVQALTPSLRPIIRYCHKAFGDIPEDVTEAMTNVLQSMGAFVCEAADRY